MRVCVAIAVTVALIATVTCGTSAGSFGTPDGRDRPLRTCKWYKSLCRFMNPCWYRRECQGYPDAVCKLDPCECRAEYYDGEEKIDCQEVTEPGPEPEEPHPEPEEPHPNVPDVIGREGCAPVLCRIFCLDGYVKDSSGCDTCECIQSGDRPGVCPAVQPGQVSTCSIECSSDAGCEEGEKCCSDGCGRVCVSACSGIQCRINCQPFGGFARDANGCEICRCMNRGSQNVCPAIDQEIGGICVDSCETDDDCTNEEEKCCINGCGHTCVRGCEPLRCRMFCEHGYETDENNCEICKCKTPPGCAAVTCRIGCKLGYERDENGCEICSCFNPRPEGFRPFSLAGAVDVAGTCPSTEGSLGFCVLACSTDEDCSGGQKCCSNGCGRVCRTPCPGVTCRMTCPFGYVKDGTGCDICRCKRPRAKLGKCPAVADGILGTCTNECESDSDCTERNMKCCSNGCGKTCVTACSPVRCRLRCRWGFVTNNEGCETCECLPSPANKPGQCPATVPATGGICTTECRDDSDCSGDFKCCSNNCGQVCVPGCPSFQCLINCPFGYLSDENGCQGCECKPPTQVLGGLEIPRVCPVVAESILGICSEECNYNKEDACPTGQMCCSNGCGHRCVEGCPPVMCRMHCRHGLARNEDGCEICECKEEVDSGEIDMLCPLVAEGVGGICPEECGEENACPTGQMCCSNGCGHRCAQGCLPVMCRMHCRHGWARNEDGCEICQCKEPISRTPFGISKLCPVVAEGVGGICSEECGEENACPTGQMCCSYGCGHSCVEGCLPVMCRMRCQYGWARNEDGCEFCQCKEAPSVVSGSEITLLCPVVAEGVGGICPEECRGENACPTGQMCCSNGCGHSCVEGCRPVMCRMRCHHGWARNEDGCEFCQCKEAPSGGLEISQVCPVVAEGVGGICSEECGEENPCPTDQICCSNGCGHSCIEGCPPVMCRMRCRHGWARNEDGCEICQCKEAPGVPGIPNACPAVAEGMLGICSEDCGEGNACPTGQICCSNGCGHSCVEGCSPVMCRIYCRFGWARDETGCEICKCKERATDCKPLLCRLGCRNGYKTDKNGCDICDCRGRPHLFNLPSVARIPLVCPVVSEDVGGICSEECSEENACPGGQMCCSNGCGHSCAGGCRPVVNCRMFCQFGWDTDENGCEICACKIRTFVLFCPVVPALTPVGGICVEECGPDNSCTEEGYTCCSNGCGHSCVEGCRPVFCRLHCEHGWARNEEGCEICNCAAPPLELVCPAVQENVGGICVEDCQSDDECEIGRRCCSNGCGHACIEACRPVLCYMYCRLGWDRDERGCEVCRCVTPQIDLLCPENPPEVGGICVEGCGTDNPCSGETEKCCSNGCGRSCVEGCRPVACRMACRDGYARNERGCEVCQCKQEIACTPPICGLTGCQYGHAKDEYGCEMCNCGPAPEELVCPEPKEGTFGICVDSCIPDTQCGQGQKCCSNGCGHQCMTACAPANCGLTGCQYGHATDENGCEMCNCNPAPQACAPANCGLTGCQYGRATDENGCETCNCNPTPQEEECTNAKVYQDCGSACPAMCETMRIDEPMSCIALCVPGCFCPAGTLLDSDDTCIAEKNCGCLYDADANGQNEYYQLGDSFQVGSERCQCRQNGQVVCKTVCAPANCGLTGCQYGRANDENGCETCNCNPAPEEPCEPVRCRRQCRFGFQIEDGCPVCKCNDPPKELCKPKKCRMYCTYGFTEDENGCEICECNPPPDVECRDGKIYQQCGTACPMTCESIRIDEPVPCPLMCVQGCFCPPGTVQDSDGMCVKHRQCGCLYDGDGDGEKEYYQLGQSFDLGVHKRERCQCRRDGRVMCTRRKGRRT